MTAISQGFRALATQFDFTQAWVTPEGHSVRGTFVHPNQDPIRNQTVQIYAKNMLVEHKLAEAKTNKYGQIALDYDWKAPSYLGKHDLIFKVFEDKQPLPGEKDEKNHVFTVTQSVSNGEVEKDFGNMEARIYEYQSGFPGLEPSELPPQKWGFSYFRDLIRAAIDELLKDLLLKGCGGNYSVKDVERVYGVNNPELELDEKHSIEMLLNGIFPCHLLKGEAGTKVLDINWDRYEHDAKTPALPNIEAVFSENDQGKLTIDKITVQFRGKDKQEYLPGNEDFKKGLYLLNSSAVVRGEVDSHLGKGHIWCEQASMAVFRNLKENPVAKLLKPHLREVVLINELGASAIFGEEGVLNVSALTTGGIKENLKDILGGMNWKFRPRLPMENEDHQFAHAGQLFWDTLGGVVDQFFDENAEGIREHWYEVRDMSKSLEENSVPYRAPDGVEDSTKWVDPSEFDYDVEGRVMVNGERRAVSSITQNEDGPEGDDIENLKQFCRYNMYMSTFNHWAVHTSQSKWVTNPSFASLAPESDGGHLPYHGTRPENARHHVSTAHVLVDFDRDTGSLVENANGDAYQPFIDALVAKEKDFSALGYDIREMTYGIII
jgi:hypothetical protein